MNMYTNFDIHIDIMYIDSIQFYLLLKFGNQRRCKLQAMAKPWEMDQFINPIPKPHRAHLVHGEREPPGSNIINGEPGQPSILQISKQR